MGGRIVFRKTARDTNGELVQFDFYLKPHGVVAEPHVHPRQEERFEVVAGRMRGRMGKQERVSKPGDTVVVPPGTPHAWWNDGEEEAHLLVEFRPALETEVFLENAWGLACDGKTDQRGVPNIWQRAVLISEFKDEMYPAPIPLPLMKLVIEVLAPIGRKLGYRARYPQYSRSADRAPTADASS